MSPWGIRLELQNPQLEGDNYGACNSRHYVETFINSVLWCKKKKNRWRTVSENAVDRQGKKMTRHQWLDWSNSGANERACLNINHCRNNVFFVCLFSSDKRGFWQKPSFDAIVLLLDVFRLDLISVRSNLSCLSLTEFLSSNHINGSTLFSSC